MVALDLKPGATHERRFEAHAVDLPGVGQIVPIDVGQTDEILVGVEVWHLA
jgi:hypothetical protein